MHAVLITFTTDVDRAELAEPFDEYARALLDVRGFVAKTWLADGDVLGGFHLFESASAADDYLRGPLLASVAASSAFGNFAIRHFDVLDRLSGITNGLGPSASLQHAGRSAG
jgi:hypothetical protein